MAPLPTSHMELPLGLEPYRNTALFSDHYLLERLPASAWFRPGRKSAARAAMEAIREIYRDVDPERNLTKAPEAQCEEELIKPVLKALGYDYLVQPSTSPGGGIKNVPDFALFDSSESKDKAREDIRARNYSQAVAIAEGKYWGRPLDKRVDSARDYATNANPSFQIVNYLIQTGQRWGILTNGEIWRLYNRDAPQPLERFYEVNLPRLLQSGGHEAFLYYFWGLFSAPAASRGPGGAAHIDSVLRGSVDFSIGVGSELRTRVFSALEHIAAGFLKGTSDASRRALDEAYDHSLIVLYRLLFVLYAESRELLPLNSNEGYRENLSLFQLIRQVVDAKERRRQQSTTASTIWSRLKSLWNAIYEGDPDLDVPIYDGELFAPASHSYLDEHSVPDLYLANALDLIGTVPGQIETRFVDYRSLSVTHLGTVYEGLLENELVVNEAKLGSVEDQVELVPTRSRRKETGSYYTPDPVVQHIVAETLDPLLSGREEEEILDLKIVDPAMGSGHFLVAAVDRLALAIATSTGAGDGDADLTTIKRRVVERCIWGVDVNPLAVELAKLSLWLDTASIDKPLSFLDHRLRAGNSVMSQRPLQVLSEIGAGDEQSASLFQDAFERHQDEELLLAEQIDALDPDSVEGIAERKALHEERAASRIRLRKLWDVATAYKMGVASRQDLEGVALALPALAPEWEAALGEVSTSLPPGDEYVPFHWELEFPEIFSRGGFDAVLGNPPYVSAWEMTQAAPLLREGLPNLKQWADIAKRHWDLFVLFVRLAQDLLLPGGRFGLIVANPLMREKYAQAIREKLLEGTIESVVDFGDTNVFEGVSRETVVMVWQKTPAEEDHQVALYDPESISRRI